MLRTSLGGLSTGARKQNLIPPKVIGQNGQRNYIAYARVLTVKTRAWSLVITVACGTTTHVYV